jgi:hypothetical protein
MRYSWLASVAFEAASALTGIECFAFLGCSSLKSICVPSGVHTIGYGSLDDCGELGHVGFEPHSQLRCIEDHAIGNSRRLQSISLPAGLESLGRAAFSWPSLNYIGIPSGNRHFSISGGHLLVFDAVAIIGHMGRPTELCIANAIEEVSDGCFSAQKSLSVVSFEPGSRLRRIGRSAFHRSGLVSIVIPASVERLEDLSLGDCDKLALVTIEANSRLSFVGETAFRNSRSLKTVRIPACLQSIAAETFGDSPDVQIDII